MARSEVASQARLIELALRNPINAALVERLPRLGLTRWAITSGCVFQTVWNLAAGRDPGAAIKDYDVFTWDEDRSVEAEQRVSAQVAEAMGDLGARVDVVNQARVHLWYEAHFGHPYTPLASELDGIDRFLAIACCVAIHPGPAGELAVYAPFGLDDLFAQVVRPNPAATGREHYEAKIRRWQAEWPALTVHPWLG